MTNAKSPKTPVQSIQDGKNRESQKELASNKTSIVRDPNGVKRALSKREIMEQLSRERFPWDE